MMKRTILLSLLAFGVALVAGPAAFATTTYGNIVGTNVTFVGIQETSQAGDPEPLFGTPSLAGSGNELTFSPSTFIAQANGAGGFDNTHSLLEMDIVANTALDTITEINITEFGDAALVGAGTAGTNVFMQMSGFLTVNATTAGPISPVTIGWIGTFTPADLLTLPSDPGVTIWSASISIDVSAELAALGIFDEATDVTLDYNNSLFAFSEAGTAATVQKKVVDGPAVIIEVIPEPTTGALVGLGLIALGVRGRKPRA